MKTYMPLNGLRWSRNSGSANCDMPQSAVFGRPGGGIFAWVSVNNSASMRCFEKAGYKQTDISEERNLALFEEPQLFYKWIMVSK